jgi:indolepyruvate decarboxylase
MYDGRLMNPDVRAYVESCDQVVTVGTLMTDFNTGATGTPPCVRPRSGR